MTRCLLLIAVAAAVTYAQETTPPVELSFSIVTDRSIPEEFSYVPQIRLTLRNNSSKEALAYVVVIRSVAEDGRKGPTRVAQYVKHALTADQVPFRAGGVFERTVSGFVDSARRPLRVEPTLDYVLFADGSEWGPDALKQSREVKAFMRGLNTAALSLSRLLDQQGIAAAEKRIREAAKSCPGCEAATRKNP